MLLVGLKRCALHTQIRQLATLYTHGRIEMYERSMCHLTRFKYAKLSNPTLSVQRLYSTNPEMERKGTTLPRLMWQPRNLDILPIVNFCISYCIIRATIDRSFRLLEFFKGVKQALIVISHALASQNYDALDGMVKERTLKILKHRVDHLTPNQRRMIAIEPELMFVLPKFMTIKRRKDLNETIVEIEVNGIYLTKLDDSMSIVKHVEKHSVYVSYKFERKYKDGTGGLWVARIVNHLK
ncbi:m-AAA protease-interacting protein 1, mitochondrial [Xylocopa sonorina]|uniref:m-AAA protease-interacting protein 1, mitochondrial n=1 Tax=Xylocopa sonorina TaxID=1818115 RepID=UPI00403A9352